MSQKQPQWNESIVKWFEDTYDVKDVGTSYFRMETCHYLPTHSDTYDLYRKIVKCRLQDCFRVVIFLEDWKSGHISEIDGVPITDWRAGDYIAWESTTPHMAGNMGTDRRYTLQLTGHR
jgi:Zn-finger protein